MLIFGMAAEENLTRGKWRLEKVVHHFKANQVTYTSTEISSPSHVEL